MEENHKGKFCPYSEKVLFCQEGYCRECEVYVIHVLVVEKSDGS